MVFWHFVSTMLIWIGFASRYVWIIVSSSTPTDWSRQHQHLARQCISRSFSGQLQVSLFSGFLVLSGFWQELAFSVVSKDSEDYSYLNYDRLHCYELFRLLYLHPASIMKSGLLGSEAGSLLSLAEYFTVQDAAILTQRQILFGSPTLGHHLLGRSPLPHLLYPQRAHTAAWLVARSCLDCRDSHCS